MEIFGQTHCEGKIVAIVTTKSCRNMCILSTAIRRGHCPIALVPHPLTRRAPTLRMVHRRRTRRVRTGMRMRVRMPVRPGGRSRRTVAKRQANIQLMLVVLVASRAVRKRREAGIAHPRRVGHGGRGRGAGHAPAVVHVCLWRSQLDGRGRRGVDECRGAGGAVEHRHGCCAAVVTAARELPHAGRRRCGVAGWGKEGRRGELAVA